MGGGYWDATTYGASTAKKVASGTSFGYDRTAKASGLYKAHEALDPSIKNADGLNIRESRDGDDHPNSVPICILLDGTGSMGTVPRMMQTKLTELFGLLLRKGYVEDPQVAISLYGDAFYDRVPLQFSQFESDNRIDDNLDKLFIEGNGGGNGGETSSLAWYYAIHHTVSDAWEKRNKKGYLFMIADEIPLEINADQVKKHIGDGEPLGSLKTKDLAEALKEKWEVYVLLIDNASAAMQGSQKVYTDLFGKRNVLIVEDPENITEVIGLAIGIHEGTVDDADQAEDDLTDVGSHALAVRGALKVVAPLFGDGIGSAIAKGSTNLKLKEGEAARV